MAPLPRTKKTHWWWVVMRMRKKEKTAQVRKTKNPHPHDHHHHPQFVVVTSTVEVLSNDIVRSGHRGWGREGFSKWGVCRSVIVTTEVVVVILLRPAGNCDRCHNNVTRDSGRAVGSGTTVTEWPMAKEVSVEVPGTTYTSYLYQVQDYLDDNEWYFTSQSRLAPTSAPHNMEVDRMLNAWLPHPLFLGNDS